jgi:hypothetical protein
VQIHLDHWGNGGNNKGPAWIDGNLHWTNSAYREGDADPARFIIDNLPVGNYTLTFTYLTSKAQGKQTNHAHDFLVSYNYDTVAGKDPLNAGALEASLGAPFPCAPRVQGNVPGPICTGAPSTLLITKDPVITAAKYGIVQPQICSTDPVSGEVNGPACLAMWGGTLSTMSGYTYSPTNNTFGGASSATVTVNFTANGGTVVLALGGHLAIGDGASGDWNAGTGASAIEGAPYHWAYQVVATSSGSTIAQGARDRSIMIMNKGAVSHQKHCDGMADGDITPKDFAFGVTQPSTVTDGLPSSSHHDCEEEDAAVFSGGDGAYSVSESPSADPTWELEDVKCDKEQNGVELGPADGFNELNSTISGTANFNFTSGQHVHCHFFNAKHGHIYIQKVTSPDPDSTNQAFEFTTNSPLSDPAKNNAKWPTPWSGNFYLNDKSCGSTPAPTTPNGPGCTLINGLGYVEDSGHLKHGTYTVTEDTTSGWTLGQVSCSIVASGSKKSSITVGASTVNLYDSVGKVFTQFTSTSITAGQAISVNLGPGDSVECVYNNMRQGSISLKKTVVNDTVGKFNLYIDGTLCKTDAQNNDTCGAPIAVTGNTTHTVSEATGSVGGLSFYSKLITCTDQTNASVTVTPSGTDPFVGTFTVAPGQQVSCTIQNTLPLNDPTAQLCLYKHVINDNGGPLSASAWTLQAIRSGGGETDFTGLEPATSPTGCQMVPAGTYSISETSMSPSAGLYTKTSDSCAGDSITIVNFSTNNVCTITNNDNAPSLILQKMVVNGASSTTWSLTAIGALANNSFTGSSVVSSTFGLGTAVNSPSTLKADTFTLSEVQQNGYTFMGWTCVNNTTNQDVTVTNTGGVYSVVLPLGASYTCTALNDGSQFTGQRMTGGGSVFTGPSNTGIRVTHGFQIHCDPKSSQNNLEVNWDGGNNFHLSGKFLSVTCTNDGYSPFPPYATFDVFTATGTGSLNGVSGATISFVFTDHGEPGIKDTVYMVIKDKSNKTVLTVNTAYLYKGNQQAH